MSDQQMLDGALQQALDFGRGEILAFLRTHATEPGRETIASALVDSAEAIRDTIGDPAPHPRRTKRGRWQVETFDRVRTKAAIDHEILAHVLVDGLDGSVTDTDKARMVADVDREMRRLRRLRSTIQGG